MIPVLRVSFFMFLLSVATMVCIRSKAIFLFYRGARRRFKIVVTEVMSLLSPFIACASFIVQSLHRLMTKAPILNLRKKSVMKSFHTFDRAEEAATNHGTKRRRSDDEANDTSVNEDPPARERPLVCKV